MCNLIILDVIIKSDFLIRYSNMRCHQLPLHLQVAFRVFVKEAIYSTTSWPFTSLNVMAD